MRLSILSVLLSFFSYGQSPVRIDLVQLDPTGAICNPRSNLRFMPTTGMLYGCDSGTWALLATASSTPGTGTVTSVAIARVNDTNVTLAVGGSPITSAGTITLTLNWTGQLAVARGGLGVGTISGVMKGNGTSPVSSATSADVIALFSGCSGTLLLAANGTCVNPTGTGTVTSFSCIGPSWLTCSVANPTSTPAVTLSATGGQTSHQVLGTCGSGTSFAPCNLVPSDLIIGSGGGTTNYLRADGNWTAPNATGLLLPSPVNHGTVVSGAGQTGTAINPGTIGQILTSNGAGADPSYQTLATSYRTRTCQSGIGDGVSAITAGIYPLTACLNEFGATWTITAIKCFTDNNGSSTLSVTNQANTSLLTGAITCSGSFASGTQSGTTTIGSGGYTKFSFTSDGTTKQATYVITGVLP